jgi:transcriptional regulator with XRE-family HTH domain
LTNTRAAIRGEWARNRRLSGFDQTPRMRRATRVAARLDGVREARRLASSLGAVVREARERQRVTQAQLGRRVGLSQARISAIERGLGVGLPLEVWIALGIALRRPVSVGFSRPIGADAALADAGHLDIQEYLLEIGRLNGRRGLFELATNRADPSHSIDICEEDPLHGCLLVLEAWNRFGDLGAAARSSDRKVAEATRSGRGTPVAVRHCWIVRDSAANRNIVRRYPEILASRFPGSSTRWAEALEQGSSPPTEAGIVWFDPSRRRLRPMRRARFATATRRAGRGS